MLGRILGISEILKIYSIPTVLGAISRKSGWVSEISEILSPVLWISFPATF